MPDPTAPPAQGRSLAGELLVATPEMGDPRFSHTVILIVRHNAQGAFGLVLNRPVEERPIASLLSAIGADAKGASGTVQIFAGGPVEPDLGFVVHSAEYRRAQTIAIDGRVAVTASPEILKDIGHGKGPKKSLIVFGYAGWAPGQLEGELKHNAWYLAPEDPALVFDAARDQLWDLAMARREIDL
jgi:putative transcriptional regulator